MYIHNEEIIQREGHPTVRLTAYNDNEGRVLNGKVLIELFSEDVDPLDFDSLSDDRRIGGVYVDASLVYTFVNEALRQRNMFTDYSSVTENY